MLKRFRRSPREIRDRLWQELLNLDLLVRGRRPSRAPERSAHGRSETRPTELAEQIRAHRFPLLGVTIDTGPEIAWRRDYIHNKETGLEYFRRIPYLDPAHAGDHKIIWELNRHQHLVVLAQAGFVDEIASQLQSWIEQNPFQRGINWASALEVGFRALSWLEVLRLVDLPVPVLPCLELHGYHLETNLSFYFSPNTHLLGEALALHAIAVQYPWMKRAARWRELGARVVREQMEKQVRPDGGHFEQSTYYHVYALDMFRYHAQLEPVPDWYTEKLARMSDFLNAVIGPARRLPFIGDDDGGRLFHPYGRRDEFGRASLINAAPPRSQLFPDTGLAVMIHDDIHIVIDAGPFGPWGSGHSHSDTLSLILRIGDENILIDPGTYTYVGDPQLRDEFRGSAAHNTIRIDGRDQATPAGPFRWTDQPSVRILNWENDTLLEAECSYAGFTHRRSVRFDKTGRRLFLDDEVTGSPGEHRLEQFWHFGSDAAFARFTFDGEPQRIQGWASAVFYEKHPAPVARIARKGQLPQRFHTEINLA